MDKEGLTAPASQAGASSEHIQLSTLCLWVAVAASIIFYSALIPFFLVVGLWLLPLVSLARFAAEFSKTKVRMDCHEKDTQSEQIPPTCHDNILYDLADTECMHICAERGHSAHIRADGFQVRSNEAYDPVCLECCCQRCGGSGSLSCTPTPSPPPANQSASDAAAISQGAVTPVYATPSPLPAARPVASPLPSPSPKLIYVPSSQLHRHRQPALYSPLPAASLGLLSPEPESPAEPLAAPQTSVTSISGMSSASVPIASPSAFETNSAKIAVLLAAALPPSPAKSRSRDLTTSAPASRRPSFANPPQRRRVAPAIGASGTVSLSLSSGSLSMSSDPGTVPRINHADLAKPSYMRGTAASRAKGSGERVQESSRLACSSRLSSGSDSVNRRALAGTVHRTSARYY